MARCVTIPGSVLSARVSGEAFLSTLDDSSAAQLKRLNRKADLSNILHAAQIAQEQRIIAQNNELLGLQRQQLAEERVFRFKMWLQTPAGSAYQAWSGPAARLAGAIRAFDEAWLRVWHDEVNSAISSAEREKVRTNCYLPRPRAVVVKSLLNPVLLAIVVVALGVFLLSCAAVRDFGPPFWSALTVFSTGTAALIWSLLYDDPVFASEEAAIAATLRGRRIALFGVDPLTSPAPTWSVDNEHARALNEIEEAMQSAPFVLPLAAELPVLTVPRLVDSSLVHLTAHRDLLATDYFKRLVVGPA